MARQQKEFTVDGETYRITQFGAREGRKIWHRLLKVLTPALEKLATENAVDDRALAGALAAVLQGLDDETTEILYESFGKLCEVRVDDAQGTRWPTLNGVIFDEHFAGRYTSMSLWLAECILFNFLPSFSGRSVGELIASLRAAGAAKSKPEPQTISTSSTGES